ncbi:MAG TPA: hypothetical protein VK169_13300 [Saprospiraceae bacterium]|nr:hypothetical protein [Saprospiraceae bacterium]
MKRTIVIILILKTFVLTFFTIGCNGPAKVEKETKVSIDTVYMKALKVALNGKCFYNPLPPKQVRDTTNNEAVFEDSFVYFSRRFEDFIIDSTLEFENSELNELVKKTHSILEVDSFNLTSFDNKTFIKASDAMEAFNFNYLSDIGFQEIQKNKLFSGYIMFSKPMIKRHSDTSYELFIRVVKIIDSSRNCYVRLLVKDDIIVKASELDFRTSLIFR